MVSIKIQCGCGQHYEFEVEPVNGQVPGPVACPVCGMDGTAAANVSIAQSPVPKPEPTALRPTSLRVAVPAASEQTTTFAPLTRSVARRSALPLPGQVDPVQARHEARAKISWGDQPAAVIGYLRTQGFSREDASELVQELLQERVILMRRRGITKIILGTALICLPFVTFFIFLLMGFPRILVIMVILPFWGLYMLIKGICMTVAPKSQNGDVFEQ
jgi:hypothetical protein